MAWRIYSLLALISLVLSLCFARLSVNGIRFRIGSANVAWTMAGNMWIEWSCSRPLLVGPPADPGSAQTFIASLEPDYNWINSHEPCRWYRFAGTSSNAAP